MSAVVYRKGVRLIVIDTTAIHLSDLVDKDIYLCFAWNAAISIKFILNYTHEIDNIARLSSFGAIEAPSH